jgi:two-component system cell cycle response regulator CtrA
MRILLAEPDTAVAQSIELMLLSESFNVYTTDLGEEAVDLVKMYDYDLALIATCPDLTDCDMLKSLRLAKCKTPVMVLSARRDTDSIVHALTIGADDYMIKPFHKDELVARIYAIVRRSKGHAASIIEVGPMVINLDAKTVTVSGKPVHLTGKEYQMLELMALRKGSLITKEIFLNHLYGGMDEPEIKIIDVFICKLRKKLDAAGGWGDLIGTVWGRGYVLGQVEVASPSLAPEVRELTDDPPTGRVAERTLNQFRKEHPELIKSPSIVPALGQK